MTSLEHSYSVRISEKVVPDLQKVSSLFSRVRACRIQETVPSETVVVRFSGPEHDVGLLKGLLFQSQKR